MLDMQKILEQVDKYFEENKGEEAERLMQQSAAQAVEEQDDGSLLQLLNELLGYYRETGQKENAFRMANQAVMQAGRMGLEGTIPYATTLLNVASAYRVFGRLQESMDYYCQVEKLYQELQEPDSMFMAGLQNNMALLYQEMGDFGKAKERLLEALGIVEKKDAAYETGVSYANLAGTCVQLGEIDEAQGYGMKSVEIFRKANILDNHYAAALSALGACFFGRGDFRKAEEYYGQALITVEKYVGRNGFYDRLLENVAACRKALEEKVRQSGGTAEAAPGDEGSAEKPASGMGEGSTEKPVFNAGEAGRERPAGSSGASKVSVGMRLAKEYYEMYGRPMIEREFSAYAGRIAAGLAGGGSDCFGYDDEASRDHDWGPDFCLWVTDETYEEIGEALQQAYERLPEEFKGYRRAPRINGAGRRGVIRISDFYKRLLGAEEYERIDWRQVDDASLAAAVNGDVFRDDEGVFSAFREKLKKGYPAEIRYLKLAESAARFSQAAQYNYPRMTGRGDGLAARMLLWEGIREAMKLQHYIEGKYPPHDKWLHRSLRESEEGRQVSGLLEDIAAALAESDVQRLSGSAWAEGAPKGLSGSVWAKGTSEGLSGSTWAEGAPEGLSGDPWAGGSIPGRQGGIDKTEDRIRHLAEYFAMELYAEGFISDTESYLDAHSEELVYKASLGAKTREQLAEEIARLEFEAFDKVKNKGGRASCQDDWGTFSIMRKSQYLTWNETMLLQYMYDFNREYHRGHNLIEEKYGRMMESTAPDEYEKIKDHFPVLTEEKKAIIKQIVGMQVGWMEEFAKEYPALAGNARKIHTWEDDPYDTSYETYLRGELGTYSDKMLELYGRYVVEYARAGKNLAYDIMGNSVRMYGYADVEEAEREVGAQ